MWGLLAFTRVAPGACLGRGKETAIRGEFPDFFHSWKELTNPTGFAVCPMSGSRSHAHAPLAHVSFQAAAGLSPHGAQADGGTRAILPRFALACATKAFM